LQKYENIPKKQQKEIIFSKRMRFLSETPKKG